MARTSLTSLDSLRKWFDLQGQTQWVLYSGHHQKMPQHSIIHKQAVSNKSLDDSREMLETMILDASEDGGHFTVFIPVPGGKGVSQRLSINVRQQSRNAALSGVPAVGMIPEARVQGMINDAVEKERLNRKIEDLEAAMGANQSIGERITEHLFEHSDQIMPGLNALFARLAGLIPQAQPIALQGVQQNPAPPVGQAQGTGYQYETAEFVPVFNQIRPHFTDDREFYDFLRGVAAYFLQSPDQIKNMILPQSQAQAQHLTHE